MKYEFLPGDKVELVEDTMFYYSDGEAGRDDAVTLHVGDVLEVFSIGQSGISDPFYNLEYSHHIHGDIDINVDVVRASETFKLKL